MQKIIITGADGRMGRALLSAVLDNPQLQLVGAVVKADSSLIGADVGELIGRGPAFGVFSRISPLVAFVELPLEITTLPPKPGGVALVAAVDLPAVIVT